MISLYTLTSSLHAETSQDASSEPFVKEVEEALGERFIFCGDDFSSFGQRGEDIIYVRTGGTEGIFKSLGLCEIAKPGLCIKLMTSGKSNSLAASMEILAYLGQKGLRGEILHGDAAHIAGRIRASVEDSVADGSPFISELPHTDLGGVRLGVIGAPSDWLIASGVDYTKAGARLGVELVDIPMTELTDRLSSAGCLASDSTGRIDMRSFDGSVAIYDALKSIVRDFGLGGLTIRCFDLLDSVHNTGCLALARLNAEGIPSGCEGDIPALISMMYLQKTRGCPGFQCNLSRIDGDELLFAHCTVPLNMVSSYSYTTHFESGIGTAIKGELREGDVEIFKIAPDLEHCVRIPGKLVRNCSDPFLCRTQIVVSAPGAASYLLRSPFANHHIISYV